MSDVYAAFLAVQADIGAITKDKRVTEGPARFSFRGVDDVMGALHGPMTKHGLICVPVVQERVAETRATRSGGAMNVVSLRVRFDFYAVDGSTFSAEAWGEGQDSSDKATGKAHSMAYKSALLEAFHVPTEDTPDADYDSTPAAPAVHEPSPERHTDLAWLDGFSSKVELSTTVGEIRDLWTEAATVYADGRLSDFDRAHLEQSMTNRRNELQAEPDAAVTV